MLLGYCGALKSLLKSGVCTQENAQIEPSNIFTKPSNWYDNCVHLDGGSDLCWKDQVLVQGLAEEGTSRRCWPPTQRG